MRKFFLLFFSLGFFSLFSQTLIIREFIISFGGNELGIGLFYFFWLFWVGMGALLVLTFLNKILTKYFFKLLLIYPFLTLLEIVLFITLRESASIDWWEFFTLEKVFVYLFIFTSFISIFTGIIFTLGIIWLKNLKNEKTSTIVGSSYLFESLGSFFAGGIATFLIIRLVSPLVILLLGSLLFFFTIIILSFSFKDKLSFFSSFIMIIFLIFLLLVPQKIINFFHHLRAYHLFPEGEFIEEIYTPYQHLLISKLSSKIIVISNGEIISTLPEVIDADKESALFISEANLPKNILIFGIGVENLINSFLKFPVKNITYVLEDKIYYKVIYKNLPKDLKKTLKDSRLKIIFQSPRLFLKRNKRKFDLIIIYTSDPSNLVINNFFTKEFFSLLKNNLKERGIVASKITSAENFIGEEIRNYGSSLYYTLKEIFPKIVIIPGKINWFIAGKSRSFLTENPEVLIKRFKRIRPFNSSFPPEGFRSIFIRERVEFVKNIYKENPLFKNLKLINSDLKPLTFFLNLLVMARYSNSYLIKFFKQTYLLGIYFFLIPILLCFLARINFILKIENKKQSRILFNGKLFQFLSGFLGFSLHLVLIFIFQNKFGTIFQFIGLVNSLFMLGLSLGAFFGNFLKEKFFYLKIIIAILIIQIIFIYLPYFFFIKLDLPLKIQFILFILFFLVLGTLTGISYPLVARVLEETNIAVKKTAVSLELLDHWGAALAGLICGFFMFPILGIVKTLVVIASICFVLLCFFVIEILPLSFIKKEKERSLLSFPYIRTSYVLFVISLSLIINSFLLEKKKVLLQEDEFPPMLEKNKECYFQKEPFPAYVCKTEKGKEFILNSSHFAPRIKGFAGPINLLLRIDKNGKIKEIRVIQHNETPYYVRGLSDFLSQFKGHSLKEEFSLDNIDAISGATVTSQAIIEIVNKIGFQIKNKLEGADLEEVSLPITLHKKKEIIPDLGIFMLVIFTFLGIIFYIYGCDNFTRKIYLILVVIFLGFFFNFTFSFFHLGNILSFNFPPVKISSYFLIYLLPLVLGLFLGQIWCGWICPFGALQEILKVSSPKKELSSHLDERARYFKYLFLVVFIVIISITRNANLFRQEPLSVFFLKSSNIFKEKILSLIIIFFSIFFLRFWCRYFCICGAFLSFFNKFFLFKKFFIKRYKNCPFGVKGYQDIDCLQCNLCLNNPKVLKNTKKDEKR
jgi:spermidine synthase